MQNKLIEATSFSVTETQSNSNESYFKNVIIISSAEASHFFMTTHLSEIDVLYTASRYEITETHSSGRSVFIEDTELRFEPHQPWMIRGRYKIPQFTSHINFCMYHYFRYLQYLKLCKMLGPFKFIIPTPFFKEVKDAEDIQNELRSYDL